MKKRNRMLNCFMAVILIAALAIFPSCTGESANHNDVEQAKVPTANIFPVGNSSRKLAVSDGSKTYFACGMGEVVGLDGSDAQWHIGQLNSEGDFKGISNAHIPAGEELFVCGDWIYYKNIEDSSIVRIKLKGKNTMETALESGCGRIIGAWGDELFFVSEDEDSIQRLSSKDLKQSELISSKTLFKGNTDFSEDNIVFLSMVEDTIYICAEDTDVLMSVSVSDSKAREVFKPDKSQSENTLFKPLCVTKSEFYYSLISETDENGVVYKVSFDNVDNVTELDESLSKAFLSGYFIIDNWLYYASDIEDVQWLMDGAYKVNVRRINISDSAEDTSVIENLFLGKDYICPLEDSIIYFSADTNEINVCDLNGENSRFLWY